MGGHSVSCEFSTEIKDPLGSPSVGSRKGRKRMPGHKESQSVAEIMVANGCLLKSNGLLCH